MTEAHTLLQLGRLAEAEAACRRAMKARPGQPDLVFLLARIHAAAGRLPEAAREVERLLARRPDFLEAAAFAGTVFESLGRLDKAEAAYRRVLAAHDAAPLWFNLGNVLRRAGRHAESVGCYGRAHALAPADPTILGALVARKQALCDWDGLEELSARLVGLVAKGKAGVQPLRMLAIECGEDVQGICARDWAAGFRARPPAHPPATAKERLTIGYLSADFHRHATAFLAAELFELHDRQRIRCVAYSLGPDDGSDIRRRLEAGFDTFHHLPAAATADVVERIRADGVDILVDLKGYTRDGRPDILAQRPAPIQVAYLGYPGSMGAGFVDYVVADPVVLPASQQPFYAERIVHLPHCYQVNDRRRPLPPRPADRTAFGLPAAGPVLVCFNAAYKISPALFAVWMEVLRAVPEAVLWLLADEAAVENALRAAAGRAGIAPERLVFAPPLPLAEHLSRYAVADLFLDTLAYNAHTTGSDALWMGCPLLTCRGRTFAARVGASLLQAVGLPELVTDSLAEYQALAIRLVQDRDALAALRRRLEEGRATAPLFDTPAFTRALEAAYARMWERAVAGLPPEGFAV